MNYYSGTSGRILVPLGRMASFQGGKVLIRTYSNRGVIISGGLNRGVPLYTEVSSFQGVWVPLYRGVLISGGWNRGVPLYTEVSLFQGIGIVGSTVTM